MFKGWSTDNNAMNIKIDIDQIVSDCLNKQWTRIDHQFINQNKASQKLIEIVNQHDTIHYHDDSEYTS